MAIIQAEYDHGVLRPLSELSLRQGEHVGIVVLRQPDPARWDLARIRAECDVEDEALADQGLDDWIEDLDREDRQ